MLLQRVITALILLPLVLGAIFYLPTPWLYLVFSAAALIAAWEWSGLMRLPTSALRLRYVLLMAAALGAAWFAESEFSLAWVILGLGCAWWVCAAAMLPRFPRAVQSNPWGPLRSGAVGILIIVPAMLALAQLHAAPQGGWRILLVFVLVWAADIGGYFAGRRWGRRKLAPNISPGKTIEGAVGGLALALAGAALISPLALGVNAVLHPGVAVLFVLTIGASIVGDLTESLFKRVACVKDSGALLPGHGGMLDRVDSLMAAAPVLALGLMLVGL